MALRRRWKGQQRMSMRSNQTAAQIGRQSQTSSERTKMGGRSESGGKAHGQGCGQPT